ncbi:hypothetical protein BDQ17DRAFT_1435213 [Cyathus striatus]|nr:hypothetical protein BDQ17DRAFT_1435213 [Cyathus striatus]
MQPLSLSRGMKRCPRSEDLSPLGRARRHSQCFKRYRGFHSPPVRREKCAHFRSGEEGISRYGNKILEIAGHFADVDDMIKLQTMVETEWKGLDTLISQLVYHLYELLWLLQASMIWDNGIVTRQATQEGLQSAVNATPAALRGNFIGPLVSAISFVRIESSLHIIQLTISSSQIPLLTLSSILNSPTSSGQLS